MKLSLPLLAIILLAGCAPKQSQLITISSDNLKPSPQQGFVYDNDTLHLSYQFFSERGVIQFTIENKLNKPLYVDWKRSAFIVGKNKMDYWRDEAELQLAGRSDQVAWLGFWNTSWFNASGTIRKSNPIDYIPPGTKLDRDQFVLVPGREALLLPGQFKAERVKSTSPYHPKPVTVQTYQYTPDNSPLAFRNYITLSTDKDFKTEFIIDSKFWASGVQVMPYRQLTGGQDWVGNPEFAGNLLKTYPYYRPDAFFVNYSSEYPEVGSGLGTTPR